MRGYNVDVVQYYTRNYLTLASHTPTSWRNRCSNILRQMSDHNFLQCQDGRPQTLDCDPITVCSFLVIRAFLA